MNRTNAQIISDLKGANQHAFADLYKLYYPSVKFFVMRNSGQEADAEDLFQDTMIVLVEKLRKEDFYLTASLKTYVIAIAKHLWFKKLRNLYRELPLHGPELEALCEGLDDQIEAEHGYSDRLKIYLTKITSHCNRLIHDWFFRGDSVQEIREKYGYRNDHTAQNQKYKCIEQIKKVK
jgi:RNA polymerase sigma factor (sigma-70 family)